MSMLSELIDQAPTIPPVMHDFACPSCGRPMHGGDVLCTRCGFNTQTGQAVKGKKARLKPREGEWWTRPQDVLLCPSRFFGDAAATIGPLLLGLVCLLYGTTLAWDRVAWRRTLNEAAGKEWPLPDNWLAHWAVVGVGGIIAALLVTRIGGWWYRKRLEWSGDPSADADMARRVYVLSWLVYDIPTMLLILTETLVHATPTEAFNSDFSVAYMAVLPLMLWTIWIRFACARKVFKTKTVPAVMWFLVLPGAWFFIQLAVMIVILIVASALGSGSGGFMNHKPDVGHPVRFSGPGISFTHPGNWEVDVTSPDYDPDGCIVMLIPGPAAWQVDIYESELSPEEDLEASMEYVRRVMGHPRDILTFDEWGNHRGKGRKVLGRLEGDEVTVLVFVFQAADGRLVKITETLGATGGAGEQQPGLQMIEYSFDVK